MKWLKAMFGGSRSGGKKMAALEAGVQAPQFELPAMNGPGFSLQTALKNGPVLAVFFKISCPVCQYAFPYFERVYKAYGPGKVSIVGISQNEKQETAEFVKRYGITFPILLDDTKSFPVSNAYGLTNVPTAFWIAEDGEIEISSVGWVRQDVEEIGRRVASAGGQAPKPIFQPSEQVADFRAG
jgi:peroxiredoxin